MTCQLADSLIEDVLNGDVDAEHADGLSEHLGECERCAEAWDVAWQVRSALNRCEAPDPGEPYFHQATARIMARIRAMEAEAQVAASSPVGTSARYGPLQVRGVGLLLLVMLASLLEGFGAPARPSAASDRPRSEIGRLPALDAADLPQTLSPTQAARNADAAPRNAACHRHYRPAATSTVWPPSLTPLPPPFLLPMPWPQTT